MFNTCNNCQIQYKPIHHAKRGILRFCSKSCKVEYHKNKKLSRLKAEAESDPRSIKTCLLCQKEFKATGSNRLRQQYCSKECKIEFHKEASRNNTQDTRSKIVRTCPICETSFTPNKTLKEIYCSAKCRKSIGRKIYKMMSSCYENTNTIKQDHAHKILGYTPNELLKHLQSFPDWSNLNKGTWHLDHIFPIAAFVRKGIKDIKLICCLENLQPLAGSDNMAKKAKYDEQLFDKWLKTKLAK